MTRIQQHVHSGRHQRGLSLIELLIAMGLSLALLGALASVYVAAKQSFRFQETSGRLQEDASFALDTVARDLRMAGYAGCMGIQKIPAEVGPPAIPAYYFPGSVLSSGHPNDLNGPNPLSMVTGLTANVEIIGQPLTPSNFLRGFDSTVPASMFATAPTSGTTDSLFFAGASPKSVTLSAAMVAGTDALTIASDPFSWGSATNVYTFVISDCAASSIFSGQVSVAGTSIVHTVAVGNSVATFPNSKLFGADAVVSLAQWHYYYVATRSGASTPSLYHVVYDGKTRQDPEEVVSNVESMRLHYGENTLNDGSGNPTLVADTWRTAAADVTDWSRVVAVRVGLMMVSSEDNANPGVTLVVPPLLESAYTVPTGASTKRLRKEFSTTIVLRNRVAPR